MYMEIVGFRPLPAFSGGESIGEFSELTNAGDRKILHVLFLQKKKAI